MTYINILAQSASADSGMPGSTPAPQTTTTQSTEKPAETEEQSGGFLAGGGSTLLWLLIFGFIFYFLLIRPQNKQRKEQQAREASLKAGDKIVTIGGLHGIVREVLNDSVKVEIAPNTVVKFVKAAIAQNLSKAPAAKTDDKK